MKGEEKGRRGDGRMRMIEYEEKRMMMMMNVFF